MKVGVDIESISRFNLNAEDPFLKSIFLKEEIDYCFSRPVPSQHLCGIFCAKEAIKKCLNDSTLKFKEILITHQENGAPRVKIEETVKLIEISISHCDRYAIACAITSQ